MALKWRSPAKWRMGAAWMASPWRNGTPWRSQNPGQFALTDYTALFSQAAGTNNIAIGSYAGRYIADGATALTIVDNSVFIGNNTRALSNGQVNQTVIGYNAIGLGSNTSVIGSSATVTFKTFGTPILTPAASSVPTVNGELTVEATSNTQLTFRLKGTDGTVRSASLTLA